MAVSFVSPYYLITKPVLKNFAFIFLIRKGAGCTAWGGDGLCANNYSCTQALHTILPYVFSSDKNVTAWGQLLPAVLLLIILQRDAFGITALNTTTGQQEKLHSYCLTIQRKHLSAREGQLFWIWLQNEKLFNYWWKPKQIPLIVCPITQINQQLWWYYCIVHNKNSQKYYTIWNVPITGPIPTK